MPVVGSVMLAGFLPVMRGMVEVALRYLGVMAGFFVIAALVVLSGLKVMLGSMLVMFCCFTMMFRGIL